MLLLLLLQAAADGLMGESAALLRHGTRKRYRYITIVLLLCRAGTNLQPCPIPSGAQTARAGLLVTFPLLYIYIYVCCVYCAVCIRVSPLRLLLCIMGTTSIEGARQLKKKNDDTTRTTVLAGKKKHIHTRLCV